MLTPSPQAVARPGGQPKLEVGNSSGSFSTAAGGLKSTTGATPALSASLILLAPLPPGQQEADGSDYKILLLQRHSRSRTYEGAWVFPGGNVDPVDSSPALLRFLPSSSSSSSHDPFSARSPALLRTLKLTALRETFEESGLLLLSPGTGRERWEKMGREERAEWRKRVSERAGELEGLLERLGGEGEEEVELEGEGMREWGRWITPEGLPRRFDTTFFIAFLPSFSSSPGSSSPALSSSSPSPPSNEYLLATPDGIETSSISWLTPSEAIRRALLYTQRLKAKAGRSSTESEEEEGEVMLLHPPQFNLLCELAQCYRSYRSLLLPGEGEGGGGREMVVKSRKVVTYLPRSIHVPLPSAGEGGGEGTRTRRAMALPGDEFYDSVAGAAGGAQEAVEGGGGKKEGRRNRTYVLPPEKGKAGLIVEGVHREGMEEVLGEGWADMQAGDTLSGSSLNPSPVSQAKL
ncbi:hypothetical protein JCM8547_000599 [Rhodosporidiobolus lusitaniae]